MAICSLLRLDTRIQLPIDEIATAQIILQLKDSFMRLAMTIEVVKYVIAKNQVNPFPIGKSRGDVAICSLLRQGIRIQLPIDEIATTQILLQLKRFIFMRLAMTINVEDSTSN